MTYKELHEKIQIIAHENGINFLTWGIKGGSEWIWIKQNDETDFNVQIFTMDGFEKYNTIKKAVIAAFTAFEYTLTDDQDVATSGFGYCHDLCFIGNIEYEKLQLIEKNRIERLSQPPIHIGTVNANGSNVIFGDAINTAQSIDNSIHEISNTIDTIGGDDKDELHITLNQAENIIAEMKDTKTIKPQKEFMKRLGNHVSKHGWFYGAIVGLLGTALLTILGVSGN